MNKQPMIFSVMAWQQNESGSFKLDVHLVAAFDSADAERRFIGSERDHLKGHCFINTDRFMNSYGRDVRTYSTRHANADDVSAEKYQRWVRVSTRDTDDGDFAPFRHFGTF